MRHITCIFCFGATISDRLYTSLKFPCSLTYLVSLSFWTCTNFVFRLVSGNVNVFCILHLGSCLDCTFEIAPIAVTNLPASSLIQICIACLPFELAFPLKKDKAARAIPCRNTLGRHQTTSIPWAY